MEKIKAGVKVDVSLPNIKPEYNHRYKNRFRTSNFNDSTDQDLHSTVACDICCGGNAFFQMCEYTDMHAEEKKYHVTSCLRCTGLQICPICRKENSNIIHVKCTDFESDVLFVYNNKLLTSIVPLRSLPWHVRFVKKKQSAREKEYEFDHIVRNNYTRFMEYVFGDHFRLKIIRELKRIN